MFKKFPLQSKGFNPFGDLIGLNFTKFKKGYSQCSLTINKKLLNPHMVIHGGVIYSMADTGMGAALYSYLNEDESCVTIEIKIVYFKAVRTGILICDTKIIHITKKFAILESEIKNNEHIIAKAIGTFSIFKIKKD